MIQKTRWLALVLVGICGVAAADKSDKDKADALFKQGKKLMADKRYSEACQALEESFKLDPGIGGELNIAKCYEEWGKLGRAYKAYQHALQMAKDANDPRAPKIEELVTSLDKQAPRLTVKVGKGGDPSAAKATLDGQPIEASAFGQPQVVDPGPHTIEWTTDSGKKNKVVPLERGGSLEVSIDLGTKVVKDHDGDKDEQNKPHAPASPAPPGRTQRIAGLAVGGAGVVAIGIASYMTLSARSKYNDALTAHCMGMTNGCDDVGLSITHDARHEANVATVVFIAGSVAVGGGIALYLLAPKGHAPAGKARKEKEKEEEARVREIWVAPSVSGDGAGVVIGGRM